MSSRTFTEYETVTCPKLNVLVTLTLTLEKLPDFDKPPGAFVSQTVEINECSAENECGIAERSLRLHDKPLDWQACPFDRDVRGYQGVFSRYRLLS